MNSKIKKAFTVVLAVMMVLAMSVSSFAVSGAADTDSTDYNTNRTGNSSAVRQENSSNTGTIRLGKILTVNQRGKFPNIEDFVYKITPVAAWDNSNVSTNLSGKNISTAQMPKPAASGKEHHMITNIEPANGDAWATLVSIGNFRNDKEDNSSSIYGDKNHNYVNSDAASNLAKIDEKKRRTRVTDVSFKFSKAGYYMYKVEEVGSRQNGEVNGLNGLRKDVAGVDYDNNSYYMVFYVCNKEAGGTVKASKYGQGTKKGDTVGQYGALNKVNTDGSQTKESSENGVYVFAITSWTNQNAGNKAGKAATDYKPDNTMRTSQELADAKTWLHDLMTAEDVDKKYDTSYGDGGHAAKLNTGKVDNNNKGVTDKDTGKSNGSNGAAGTNEANLGPSTVTHENLGKVGISTPYEPDYLEAYRMWNAQTTHDVVIRKNVTGNLGDLTKEFVFDVTLTGLEFNQTYTTNVPAGTTDETADAGEATGDTTSPSVVMYDMKPEACLSSDGKSFTTDSTGTVSFRIKLRDDDIFVMNALPRSASYQITEEPSDHVAQYNIVSTNMNQERPAVFTETGHTPGGKDAAHLGAANKDSNMELPTKVEFVDRYDGTVTILFQNNRDISTLTGVPGIDYAVYTAILAILGASVFAIIRRRREYADEEC